MFTVVLIDAKLCTNLQRSDFTTLSRGGGLLYTARVPSSVTLQWPSNSSPAFYMACLSLCFVPSWV